MEQGRSNRSIVSKHRNIPVQFFAALLAPIALEMLLLATRATLEGYA